MEKRNDAQNEIVTSTSPQTIQVPECPVCWEGFNDGARMPRLLRCGHTICQMCLNHLLFDAGLGQRCIRCPECRGLCMWRGIQELPKNYILLRVLGPGSLAGRGSQSSRKFFSTLLDQVFLVPLSNIATIWLPRLVERKLWDVAKLVWAVIVMVVLLPLSFGHMVLSWWTAILGFVIFLWVTIGGVGIAVFMFFLWCSCTVGNLVYKNLRRFINGYRRCC